MGQALHALCSYKEYKQTSLQSPPESGWEEDGDRRRQTHASPRKKAPPGVRVAKKEGVAKVEGVAQA